MNIEAYGTETQLPWRMGILENGMYKEVHPTFLYESIITFILFIILIRVKAKRKYMGQITFLYLTIYGVARSIIEGLRIDSLMYQNLRISQIISIVLFVAFGSILLYRKVTRKETAKNGEKWR